MKPLLTTMVIGLMMTVTSSQANLNHHFGSRHTVEWDALPVTKSVQESVNAASHEKKINLDSIRIKKPKLLRSNPHRLTSVRLQGGDPYNSPDDEYLCASSVRRPKIIKNTEDISDYAMARLSIARMLALKKYRENWA